MLRVRTPQGLKRVTVSPGMTIGNVAEDAGVPKMAISLSGKSNEIVPFNSLIKNLPLQNGDILVAVNPHMGGEQMHEGPSRINYDVSHKEESSTGCVHPASMKCSKCIQSTLDKKNMTEGDIEEMERRERQKLSGPPPCSTHGPQGSCVKCMSWTDSLLPKIRHQDEVPVTSLRLANDAANSFQAYLQETGFSVQRCGWLIGRVEDDKLTDEETEAAAKSDQTAEEGAKKVRALRKAVVVEAIYEPPQRGTATDVTPQESVDETRAVDVICEAMGLSVVGFLFSHPPRRYNMTSSDVMRAATHQAKYGPEFVTATLSYNKRGHSSFEAFQTSRQAVNLQEEGYFKPPSRRKMLETTKEIIVENRKETTLDAAMCYNPVAIQSFKGMFMKPFAIENRMTVPSIPLVKAHMKAQKGKPFHQQISDFHLLLYLSRHFDVENDLPMLCMMVATGLEDGLEGYQMILDSLLN